MREQLSRIRNLVEHRLDHPVVHERQQRGAIVIGERPPSRAPCRYATPRSMRVTTSSPQLRAMSVAFDDHGDIVPEARHDEQADVARASVVSIVDRAVCQQAVERRVLGSVERTRDLDEVPESRNQARDGVSRADGRERGQKFRDSERRQRGAAAQGDNFGHAKL